MKRRKTTKYNCVCYRGNIPLIVKINAKNRKSLYRQIASHLIACENIGWHCDFKGEVRYYRNNRKIDKVETIIKGIEEYMKPKGIKGA